MPRVYAHLSLSGLLEHVSTIITVLFGAYFSDFFVRICSPILVMNSMRACLTHLCILSA